MSITKQDVETVRDIAAACALIPDYVRSHCPVTAQQGITDDDPLPVFRSVLGEIRRVKRRLSELDADITAAVLHLLRVANPPRNRCPSFAGHEFRTFHELAMWVPDILSEALTALVEYHSANKTEPTNYLDLFPMRWRLRQPEDGDFPADEIVIAIEREATAAIQHLAEPPQDVHRKLADSDDSVLQRKAHTRPVRDPELEARDALIYKLWCDGVPWAHIQEELLARDLKDLYLESLSGIRRAARRYAERHQLPIPPNRPPGRPALS